MESNGQVQLTEVFNMSDPMAQRLADQVIARDAELRKQMAPAGALGLPKLLDERRLEYGIPDNAFEDAPAFDVVFVRQIEKLAYKPVLEGGMIVAPEQTAARETQEASEGILIAAGLKALDSLRSNGIDLGHMVRFIKLAPWRMETGKVGGKPHYVLVLRAGDIVASRDVRSLVRSGFYVEKYDADNGQHIYVGKDGSVLRPEIPWISEDS